MAIPLDDHTECRVANLRAQLQSHFLFNALNSIAALVGEDANGARRMLARLSELLRLSFSTMRQHAIPLAQELEIVSSYLEIERVRFSDRLRVEMDVADDCLDAAVPPFLLQPLAENAVKHGVAGSNERCTIRIHARRNTRALHIAIENDCPATTSPIVERVGATNTRERLDAAYGSDASFELVRRQNDVVVATLMIPLAAA